MVWQRIVLGTVLEKVWPVIKKLIRNSWKSYGPDRGHHLLNFSNMVWQGIVLGTIFEKVRPVKNLIRNMWKRNGSDEGQSFSQLHQHGLAGDCLGNHF